MFDGHRIRSVQRDLMSQCLTQQVAAQSEQLACLWCGSCLQLLSVGEERWCDACSCDPGTLIPSDQLRWRCDECDFDLCVACALACSSTVPNPQVHRPLSSARDGLPLLEMAEAHGHDVARTRSCYEQLDSSKIWQSPIDCGYESPEETVYRITHLITPPRSIGRPLVGWDRERMEPRTILDSWRGDSGERFIDGNRSIASRPRTLSHALLKDRRSSPWCGSPARWALRSAQHR